MSRTYDWLEQFLNTDRRREAGRFINYRFKFLMTKDKIALYDNRCWMYIFSVSNDDTLCFHNRFKSHQSKFYVMDALRRFGLWDLDRILTYVKKNPAYKHQVYIPPPYAIALNQDSNVAYQIDNALVIDIPSGSVVTGTIAQPKPNPKDFEVNTTNRRVYMRGVKNIRKILALMHLARAFDLEERITFSFWEQRRIVLQTPLDVFVKAIKEGRVTEDLHYMMTRATGFYLTPEAAFNLYLNQYRVEIRIALGVLE